VRITLVRLLLAITIFASATSVAAQPPNPACLEFQRVQRKATHVFVGSLVTDCVSLQPGQQSRVWVSVVEPRSFDLPEFSIIPVHLPTDPATRDSILRTLSTEAGRVYFLVRRISSFGPPWFEFADPTVPSLPLDRACEPPVKPPTASVVQPQK
jgi:hypothetical protein